MTRRSAESGEDVASFRERLSSARKAMAERMSSDPRAYSADGQSFGFSAPIVAETPIGGYVSLRTDGGVDYLGQITTKAVVEREGPEVSVEGDAGLGAAVDGVKIAQTSFRIRLQQVAGGGILLGRRTEAGIVPTGPSDVFEEAAISLADGQTVADYFAGRARGRVSLDIGTIVVGNETARAPMLATGFDRHTFLCGQSGSGKTYALGLILERLLLETDLRLVIVDPNSDFVRLGEPRPAEQALHGFGSELDAAGLASLRERYLAATAGIRVLRPARRGTTSPDALRICFSDLAPAVQQITAGEDRRPFALHGTEKLISPSTLSINHRPSARTKVRKKCLGTGMPG